MEILIWVHDMVLNYKKNRNLWDRYVPYQPEVMKNVRRVAKMVSSHCGCTINDDQYTIF